MADFVDRSRKISLIGMSQLCTILLMVLETVLFVTEHKSLGLYVVFIMIVAWMTALQPLFNSLSFKLEESGVHINFGVCRSLGSLGYSHSAESQKKKKEKPNMRRLKKFVTKSTFGGSFGKTSFFLF